MSSIESQSMVGGGEEELLGVAGNPETDTEMLREMAARCGNRAVRAALARNPSTPISDLQALWRRDPGAILENPLVFLWEFTRPGLAREMIPKDCQFMLYQHLLVQDEFVPRPDLIDCEWVAWHLANDVRKLKFRYPLHVVVRDDTLKIRMALLKLCVRNVKKATALAARFPQDAIEVLAADSRSEVREALSAAIAEGWLTPEPMDSEFLIRMARELISKSMGNLEIAASIARWPVLNATLIERLAMQASEGLLVILAGHPKASPSFQARMASHPYEQVRARVASVTPVEELIERLARDPNPLVRAGLASSPHLTPEIQRALYANRDSGIILGLVKNPITLPELLEAISKMPNLAVVGHLRGNPNTPKHVLKSLELVCPMPVVGAL